MERITVAVTGASGAIYGVSLARHLLAKGFHVNIIISPVGLEIVKEELDLDWHKKTGEISKRIKEYYSPYQDYITYHPADAIFSPLSSGSFPTKAMIVCPCSMGTLARIAGGISSSLIERAADVVIKEGRRLILVPRETPLNPIHLENMLKLSTYGITILPAMPAFYHKPEKIEDMVDFVIGKVLDQLGIENTLFVRWGNKGVE